MRTRNLGADFSKEIGDWGFKMGSIGRIFLLESTSVGGIDTADCGPLSCLLSASLWEL
uniref:Uncharacterized protein n=1 Tax=Rhizophora mucronata TaxID=61149 RepID=A0A2P2NR72_RHIMU